MRTMNITRPLLSGLAIAAATWLVACSFQKTADPWTKDQLKDPAVLAQEIKENKAPVIFDIGPAGSIKGSVEIGATEDKEAMALLGTKLDGLAKNTEVVIYCGCCPFSKCPNVRPAFNLLKEKGFTNGKLLNLPQNLKTDWIDHGYPMQ
jgi:rhodanese-related sulfurtransferase